MLGAATGGASVVGMGTVALPFRATLLVDFAPSPRFCAAGMQRVGRSQAGRAESGWDDPTGPSDEGRRSVLGGVLASFGLGVPLVACAGWQVRSTWSTPPEWAGIRDRLTRAAAGG